MKEENKKTLVSIGMIILSIIALYCLMWYWRDVNSTNVVDGYVYIEIGNTTIEQYLGHNEVMEFCRNNTEHCYELFYGCGAVNCRCVI